VLTEEGRLYLFVAVDGALPLDEPSRVVSLAARRSSWTAPKVRTHERSSLQGSDETLRASVPLGRVDEDGRALDVEEGDVALEV
jgi:hypothetical protein